jgi:amylosucrase
MPATKDLKLLDSMIGAIENDPAITNTPDSDRFITRLQKYLPSLLDHYRSLYDASKGCDAQFKVLVAQITASWSERSADLTVLDVENEANPDWFEDQREVGGVCYVDLFAGDLKGIQAKIPYFKELGLTYLHLMPFFLAPEGENDGGYAVSSYRDVDPKLGTMEDLRELARALHANGIRLVADFVFNHTSDEHRWAQKAKTGDTVYKQFFYMFDDRQIPDAYEKTLREIFPSERPGSFTFFADIDQWVWTTFHSFQWDLNYANPAVFNAMVGEMLFLANQGVDVLRLDAVAFIWKEMGTTCENLPQAHMIIQAFNLACRIAAPSMYFKSEAIVHPDEVIKYIDPGECQLSYNPLLMALLWNCLASKEIRLLRMSVKNRYTIPAGTSWVNYVRCHDDIGWTFSDEDAEKLQIHGFYHRKWLNEFYSGEFPGSFARGLLFQENKKTGDARISGQAASLAGLEKALAENDNTAIEMAIDRILMLYTIVFTIGGLPLIYLGDEIGMLNDYSYRNDPAKQDDSRWVHRTSLAKEKLERRKTEGTIEGRIFARFQEIIRIRKSHSVFSGSDPKVVFTDNDHIFAYQRKDEKDTCIVMANFADSPQSFNLAGMDGKSGKDCLCGDSVLLDETITMQPYQVRIVNL